MDQRTRSTIAINPPLFFPIFQAFPVSKKLRKLGPYAKSNKHPHGKPNKHLFDANLFQKKQKDRRFFGAFKKPDDRSSDYVN